jgi:hypothetical protein
VGGHPLAPKQPSGVLHTQTVGFGQYIGRSGLLLYMLIKIVQDTIGLQEKQKMD